MREFKTELRTSVLGFQSNIKSKTILKEYAEVFTFEKCKA